MAHEIMELDTIGLANTAAWHKLGTVVQGTMNPREAVRRFLGWSTNLEPVYGKLPDGSFVQVGGYRLHSRTDVADARRYLAVVGDGYTPISHDSMLEDIEAICGESGAEVDTIGSLRNGRTVWILCKLNQQSLIKGDSFDHYMLFANNHDGRRTYEIMPTTVRVVCNNTWTAATGPGAARIAIAHRGNAQDRIKEARRIIGKAQTSFARFAELAGGLADAPVSEQFTDFFIEKMFPTSREDGTIAAVTQARRDEVHRAIGGHCRGGLTRATRRTAFGLYNAVTEYTEHLRRTVNFKDQPNVSTEERRLLSNWFGGGAELRQSALDFLLNGDIRPLMEADSALDLATATPELDRLIAASN